MAANIIGISKFYWELMIRNPRPFLAPVISAATRSKSEIVALSLRPTKIAGVAVGRTTRRNTSPRDAPKTRAISINRRSTSLTPEIVFSRTGKKAAHQMIAIFDVSPRSSSKMKIG